MFGWLWPRRRTVTLNLTINEGCPAQPAITPGTYQVRAHYNEADVGKVFGSFATREAAEVCLNTLAARVDVLSAELETL